VDEVTQVVDPSRDLTIASLDWTSGAAVSPPIVIVWLHPAKDPDQRKPRYPMVVQRRSASGPYWRLGPSLAPLGSDPMCTYNALRAAWDVLAAPVPLFPSGRNLPAFGALAPTPPSQWRPILASDIALWVGQAAQAAGLPAASYSYGSRALRIGGATDLYDLFGPYARDHIQDRGRWSSDVAQIYQRASASTHGLISRPIAIADSQRRDLQSLLRGWSQPAAIYGRCPLWEGSPF
jgi:hypothetical protein